MLFCDADTDTYAVCKPINSAYYTYATEQVRAEAGAVDTRLLAQLDDRQLMKNSVDCTLRAKD